MARQPVSRPVSGEILTKRPARDESGAPGEGDIVEAEYETVVRGRDKPGRATEAKAGAEMPGLGLNVLTGGEREAGGGRAGPAFWVAGAVAVGAAFWISGGHAVFWEGGTGVASAATNPLKIQEVSSRVKARGSRSYLLVDGTVVNSGETQRVLPNLIIQVKSGDGSVTRYRIAGGDEVIMAGGRFAFASRLATPHAGVENVRVVIQEIN